MSWNAKELLWLPITLVILIGVYAYGFGNPLVFDDGQLADGNLFAAYAGLELKPRLLSYGSFVWLRALFGEAWWMQRLVNLLVHIAVTLALWGFYRDLLRRIDAGPTAGGAGSGPALGVAVAFFALNPVAVYAVAYLIQRSILLATLFVVLALWAFVRALTDRSAGLAAVSLLCYLLAVAAKEHAVMAPLAAVPLYILVRRPEPRQLLLGAGAGLLVLAAVGGALYYRYGEIIGQPFDQFSRIYLAQLAALGPDVERQAYPLSLLNQSYLFFRYALHWLLPWGGWMSIDLRPPFPVSLAAWPQLLGAVAYPAVWLVGGFLLLRFRDRRALLGVALLLPAILFATEFSTVWVQDPFVLYRSYLWAIGLPGLLYVFLCTVPPRLLLVGGLLLAGLFGAQALERVHSMSSPERLWQDVIAKHPDDARSVGRWFPYLIIGNRYLDQGRNDRALEYFQRSAALGDHGMGMFNVGAVLYLGGAHAEALAAVDAAAAQGYDFPGLNHQRAVILRALGRTAEARAEYSRTLERAVEPAQRIEALAMRAQAALEMGDPSAAVGDLEALLGMAPGHRQARLDLGLALVMRGEHARALELLNGLLAEAADGPSHYARALAYHGLRRKAEALADIEQAIRLGPEHPGLQVWLARIRAMP